MFVIKRLFCLLMSFAAGTALRGVAALLGTANTGGPF